MIYFWQKIWKSWRSLVGFSIVIGAFLWILGFFRNPVAGNIVGLDFSPNGQHNVILFGSIAVLLYFGVCILYITRDRERIEIMNETETLTPMI